MAERFRLGSRLYAIVDPGAAGGADPVFLAKAFLRGGVRGLQLRWKDAPTGDLLRAAKDIATFARESGALFFVNDRLDVALAAEADGVHLGQDDLPLEAARAIAGSRLLIGVSTHDLEQARKAEHAGADLIGFGPMFGTRTKATGYTPRGLDGLREIRPAVTIPIVAIGGIDEANARSVLEAGADAVAMISELSRARDRAAKVRSVLARLAEARG